MSLAITNYLDPDGTPRMKPGHRAEVDTRKRRGSRKPCFLIHPSYRILWCLSARKTAANAELPSDPVRRLAHSLDEGRP